MNIEELRPLVEQNLMKDGELYPVMFVESLGNGNFILDIRFGMESDETKEKMVRALVEMWKQQQVYSFTFVTEVFQFVPPEGMDPDTIRTISETGEHRTLFDKTDAYMINYVTKESCTGIFRTFKKDENGKIVFTGEPLEPENMQLHTLQPLQDALISRIEH